MKFGKLVLIGTLALAGHFNNNLRAEEILTIATSTELIPALQHDLTFHRLALKEARKEWALYRRNIERDAYARFEQSAHFFGRDERVHKALRAALATAEPKLSLEQSIELLGTELHEVRMNRPERNRASALELAVFGAILELKALRDATRPTLREARLDAGRRLFESRTEERQARLALSFHVDDLKRLEKAIADHSSAVVRLESDLAQVSAGARAQSQAKAQAPAAASSEDQGT